MTKIGFMFVDRHKMLSYGPLFSLIILLAVNNYVTAQPRGLFAFINNRYYAFIEDEEEFEVAKIIGCVGGDLVSFKSTRNSEVREFFDISANETLNKINISKRLKKHF